MRKILHVARYEFISTITRLGYIVTLIGMPIFFGTVTFFATLLGARSAVESLKKERKIGWVDESGLFAKGEIQVGSAEPAEKLSLGKNAIPSSKIEITRFASFDVGMHALKSGSINQLLRVPKDYLARGKLEEFSLPRRQLDFAVGKSTSEALRPWMVRTFLEGNVAPELAARAANPWQLNRFVVEADGKIVPADILRELRPLIVPLGMAMMLFFSIFTSASFLATGVAEEKQNRALEFLITLVNPTQLFWGKLLGLGGAALLQFAIYTAVVALPASLVVAALGIRLAHLFLGGVYFLLGFLLFGALLLMIGSLGNSQKYTQQLSGAVTLVAMFPVIMLTTILGQPSGSLARALTYIPFTAPVTSLLRMGADSLPWWEALLSVAALGLGAIVLVIMSAKVFRLALLSSGTTPRLSQLISWLRH